jgi:hypothetical protein
VRCPIETQENLELLLDYGTTRIANHDALAFEQHLKTCAVCREAVGGQQNVQSALDLWEVPEVSASFNRRLYERIERPGWHDRLAEAMSRALHILLVGRGVPVAAAACLIVTAGIMSYHQPKPAMPNPQAVQVETAAPEQVVHELDDMEMLRNFDRAIPAGEL